MPMTEFQLFEAAMLKTPVYIDDRTIPTKISVEVGYIGHVELRAWENSGSGALIKRPTQTCSLTKTRTWGVTKEQVASNMFSDRKVYTRHCYEATVIGCDLAKDGTLQVKVKYTDGSNAWIYSKDLTWEAE